MAQVETPGMRALNIREEVIKADKTSYTKGEVSQTLKIVADAMGGYNGAVEVDAVRRGDVFLAKVTGGKVRPWVAIRSVGGIVSAVAMSSGDKFPKAIRSQSRYWPENWLGATISVFNEEFVRHAVTLLYGNMKHLREVERQLSAILKLRS